MLNIKKINFIVASSILFCNFLSTGEKTDNRSLPKKLLAILRLINVLVFKCIKVIVAWSILYLLSTQVFLYSSICMYLLIFSSRQYTIAQPFTRFAIRSGCALTRFSKLYRHCDKLIGERSELRMTKVHFAWQFKVGVRSRCFIVLKGAY